MNLFDINNLTCAYNGGPPVLEVPRLSITDGKLVVIIGLSGAGKSTLLETLGLMNDTIRTGSSINFTPAINETYQFENIWNDKKDSDIFEVRRHHFSFIFQSTNLMPNFTVYENICLTQTMQGTSLKDAMKNAEKFMKLLGLQEIDKNKNSYEISGGQAQRVAFVRAITPEFTVLFGDEPTGNLDEKNSWDLMTVLKGKIREWNKTAIIVTHNINLALEFADQIILITKPNNHGVIEQENIFHRNEVNQGWRNNSKDFDEQIINRYLKEALGGA